MFALTAYPRLRVSVAFVALGCLGVLGCNSSDTSAEKVKSQNTPAEKVKSSKASAEKTKSPDLVRVPAKTAISIRMKEGIDTEKNNTGDAFRAVLDQPIEVNGRVLAPAGTVVNGKLLDVAKAGRIEGRSSLTLELDELVLDGKSYDMQTAPLALQAKDEKKKDAETIAGGTIAGAVVGAIAGGKKGALKGGVVGGAAGTGYVLATKGDAVVLSSGTQLVFELNKSVMLPPH